MPPGTGREAGFTLLEVLVALVVLGLIVAGLGQGLRFGLRATERQEQLAAQRGDLEAVDRVLRRLVQAMDPGTSRELATVVGDRGALAFTTELGDAAGALGQAAADVRLGVQGGRLLLRWRPALHAVRLVPPPPEQEAVLLDGLERIELSYWGPAGEGAAAWQGSWRGRALPLLVRVRLVFPAGSGRRWPDIVAAPARPRPLP